MSSIETMGYWPREILKADDVPLEFMDGEVEPLLKGYSVYFPSEKMGQLGGKGKILSLSDGLYQLYENGRRIQVFYEDIIWLEYLSVLLKGSLMIKGKHCDIHVQYNTVREHLIIPFLQQVCPHGSGIAGYGKSSLQFLLKTNIKFYTIFSRLPLDESEKILFLYQHTQDLNRGGQFLTKLLPSYLTAYLLILTNRGLFVLREPRVKSRKSSEYGIRVLYIPRKNLEEISHNGKDQLSINIKGDHSLILAYSLDNLSAIENFCNDWKIYSGSSKMQKSL